MTWPPLTLHDDENRRREGQDITFRVGNLADSSLVARRLVPMNYVVAAALLGQGLVLFPTWLIGDALSKGIWFLSWPPGAARSCPAAATFTC